MSGSRWVCVCVGGGGGGEIKILYHNIIIY